MRVRRLKKDVAHLEVTAFINLIVVLVPFLLSTAVFTRLSVVDLSLPTAAVSPAVERLQVATLQLEVVIRADALEVGDRIGGLIQRIPSDAQGRPDTDALARLVQAIKQKYPAQQSATVLAQPETPYERLVAVMDAVREQIVVEGPQVRHLPLFPMIVVGDAPRALATPTAAARKGPGA